MSIDRYQGAAEYADRIERELRKLNAWQSEPLPDSAYASRAAFFADTMTLYQWLQFVLLRRVRDIIKERGAFPEKSSVGAHAVRELDGCDEAADLVRALCEFDRFIESQHHSSRKRNHP